jgi:hypothetical protein
MRPSLKTPEQREMNGEVSPQVTELKTWKYTKWLIVTSLGFMIPAFYAYQNQVYFLSGVLVVTSLVSANYWRFPITDSLRYKTDLIVAKLAFCIFFANGYVYVRSIPYIITTYPSIAGIGYCYYMSCKLSSMNDANWNKYHIVFHLLLIYCEWVIIDSAIPRKIDSI